MKILGIDPGYGILGWAVIGSDRKVVELGSIKTSKEIPYPDRLLQIYSSLKEILSKHHPSVASVEKVFFSKNTGTAIDVAKTIGVVQLALKLEGIDFFEYTPSQVKQAVTGYGKADKKQVEFMVMKIFNLSESPGLDDVTDALAIAACHWMNSGTKKL